MSMHDVTTAAGDLIGALHSIGPLVVIVAGGVGALIYGWPKPDPDGDAAEDLGRAIERDGDEE
jgi:hypothetical protein